ncbi:BC1881 family protein [uncultured Clostridium sp.]|uniref:BC1881 family protein n=1 Tax=uncultured Clostridium sp. TaxID=59620 RepID=UPI00262399DA|nr:BC1881 family protein [uncultured Clostridium sp.]
MDLKEIETKELVNELRMREQVKSSVVTREESAKIIISGHGGSRERYIRFTGPGIVIQVEKLKL